MFTKLEVYQRDRDGVSGGYGEPKLINTYTTNTTDIRQIVRDDEAIFGCEHINLANDIWCIDVGFIERFYVFS